jgi:predicted porin
MFAKKIVAGAAMLAAAVAAQAGVNVYGTVDLGLFSVLPAHEEGDKRNTHVASGTMTTSFLGFSGSEDLGGGLKAEFALETFLAADTGSSTATANKAGGFWSRASNIALSGSFGKVAIGQYDNAFFTYGLTYNPFGASMTMSPTMRHFYALGPVANGALLSFDTGWVNSITYETPNLSGFNANVQWSPKEATGGKDSLTIGGQYNAGPLSIGAAYAAAGFATAYDAKQKDFTLGVSYDFGVVKAFGQYTDVKSYVDATATKDFTAKIFQLGVSVPVSAQGAVLASYGEAKVKFEDGKGKNKVFSLAYDHALSKRTDAYVGLVNERQTELKSGTTFGVGLRHAF